MFRKLLVANRGEIAIRVMRACRDLDIAPVGVYSDADRDALHTRLAAEAYRIGEAPAAASYLRIEAIVDAARRSGSDAVHPGYGFLAENGDFARAVIDAGLAWVGPHPDVMDAMGDKTSARRAAADAGVPTVPGTAEPVTEAEQIGAFAAEHGLPLAIKASAGGGGKGFRVVSDPAEFAEGLAGARREAEAYFSSGDVYLERYLERPRHVEVQVLGDASGAILTFPERDCSLQRRHQKLIEESPCPTLDTAVREALMDSAARVCKQVGYRNAGTCEFLLDADGRSHFFLEMNTRLQVEHPVTELVCGIDLVTAQILVASGESLGLSQSDVELSGHAIECRINAEDPARNFMPAPGLIKAYREPAGPGVRVDSAAEPGTVISQAYDPLIAKLIAHGADREEARRRTLRALSEYRIEGVRSTVDFHRLVLSHDAFVSGVYDTSTVERDLDLGALAHAQPPAEEALPELAERRFLVEIDGKRFSVRARERPAGPRPAKPRPPARSGSVGAGTTEVLAAPMQGVIVEVLVAEGDEVAAGQAICVLEAMKMENAILAHTDGVVSDIRIGPGDSVEAGAALATIR